MRGLGVPEVINGRLWEKLSRMANVEEGAAFGDGEADIGLRHHYTDADLLRARVRKPQHRRLDLAQLSLT
jgi:hypothetical protein